MALADRLKLEVNIDLTGTFGTLAGQLTGADLGAVRFDASGLVALVDELAPPQLDGVLTAVGAAASGLTLRLPVTVGTLPGLADLEALADRIAGIGPDLFDVDTAAEAGLDALAGRVAAVQAAMGTGRLADLLGLVPGVSLGDVLPRVGGATGGLIALIQILGGLSATSAVTAGLAGRAERMAGLLDVGAATAAAADLAQRCADTGLVSSIRDADPDDQDTVASLSRRIADFQGSVLAVADTWATGMGFGEAALAQLDLTGSVLGLAAGRLALETANITAVGEMAAALRQVLSPAIDTPLPDPGAIAGSAVDAGLALIGRLTGAVDDWDATKIGEPARELLAVVLDPLRATTLAIEQVGTQAAAAIRTVGQVVTELDLTPVADAIRRALQPVVDALDAIGEAVATAESTLRTVCGDLTTGLNQVTGHVEQAANTVRAALLPVRTMLSELDLTGLAERLRAGLTSVAAALASAQLSPYFDAAIDIIDTTADVVDAVPFALLPTDVQQEIVDVCKPVKQLKLQPIEDELRSQLTQITASLQADALDAIEAAHAQVVAFLASLDPLPHLATLESVSLAELRTIVDGIDPAALLAPVTEKMAGFTALLDGVDLEAAVLEPLEQALVPVSEALAAIDPAELLSEVSARIAQVRTQVLDVLRLDDADTALTDFRDRVAAMLDALDPVGLAGVLGQAVADRLREPEPGPPGGVVASLVTMLAQATGLDSDEAGVAEALQWIGGADGAAVVRERLDTVAVALHGTAASVRALDPGPLVAAAQAQRRALTDALGVHPADSGLRTLADPLLAGRSPADVLGPLIENRQRYLAGLDAQTTIATGLAASGRSEITVTANGVRAALAPLDAIPVRLRAIVERLGIVSPGTSFTDILRHLLDVAGPARLVLPFAGLVETVRGKALQALDALLVPVRETVGTLRSLVAAFDIEPVQAELVALHQQVTAEVAAASPRALLGDVLDAAEQARALLADFDPLGPISDVLTEAKAAATRVLDTARPTVVFADAVAIHGELVQLAAGLDVRSLLEPVLTALESLAGQLDTGFDRTGDALQRLQASLPDKVSDMSISGGVEVSIL